MLILILVNYYLGKVYILLVSYCDVHIGSSFIKLTNSTAIRESRSAYTSLFLAYQNKLPGWNTCLLFQCSAAMSTMENIVFWFYQALK